MIVGLQAVYFFLTARWFGITEGLLPEDPLIRRMVERPRRLEWALLVGTTPRRLPASASPFTQSQRGTRRASGSWITPTRFASSSRERR